MNLFITGSGKSTLVDIICGLQKANSGKIFIDDKDVNLLNKNWSNKISYIQQNETKKAIDKFKKMLPEYKVDVKN